MNKIYIEHINIGPMGKIIGVDVKGVENTFTRDEFFKLCDTNKHAEKNFTISETGSIIVDSDTFNENFLWYKKHTTYSKNALDYELIEVTCEEHCIADSGITYIILEAKFKCNTSVADGIFRTFGAKQVSDSIYSLTNLQISKILNTNNFLNNLIDNNEIKWFVGLNYLIYVGKDKTKLKIDNTHFNKLEAWITKAKLLGIYGDYKINLSKSELVRYRGTNTKPLLPPVRKINYGCFDGTLVEELIIPDTVMTIMCEFGNVKGLRKLKLGDNSGICDKLSIQSLNSLEELDLGNVNTLHILRYFKNMRKITMKTSTSISHGVFNNSATDVKVQIELIEG